MLKFLYLMVLPNKKASEVIQLQTLFLFYLKTSLIGNSYLKSLAERPKKVKAQRKPT